MSTIQKLKDEIGKLNKLLASNKTKTAKANKFLSDENKELNETINTLQTKVTELSNKLVELETAIKAQVDHLAEEKVSG